MRIAIVGLSGIPYLRRASDYRVMAFAQIFADLGYHFYVINRYPVTKKKDRHCDHSYSSKIKFIEILDTDKPNSKIFFFLLKVLSYPREFIKIVVLNKRARIDCLQVYSGHYFELLIYKLLSKTIGTKLIYHYVEFRSEIERKGIYHKLNGYLCDNFSHSLFDGIICISHYLENHIIKKSPEKPVLRIPPLCNYSLFKSAQHSKIKMKYILFCGSAGYWATIKLVIDSFRYSSCVEEGIKLVLVTNGSQQQMRMVSNYIKNDVFIKIQSNLHYSELINLYENAFVSMIPLSNTIQDIARFPNKIGEYCASKSVILTTNVGEIPYYFEDKKNALIVKENTPEQIAKKIDWAISNEHALEKIRKCAYDTGKIFFNIESYTNDLDEFLKG